MPLAYPSRPRILPVRIPSTSAGVEAPPTTTPDLSRQSRTRKAERRKPETRGGNRGATKTPRDGIGGGTGAGVGAGTEAVDAIGRRGGERRGAAVTAPEMIRATGEIGATIVAIKRTMARAGGKATDTSGVVVAAPAGMTRGGKTRRSAVRGHATTGSGAGARRTVVTGAHRGIAIKFAIPSMLNFMVIMIVRFSPIGSHKKVTMVKPFSLPLCETGLSVSAVSPTRILTYLVSDAGLVEMTQLCISRKGLRRYSNLGPILLRSKVASYSRHVSSYQPH